ncbi:hypothetical protein ElyMa_001736100 [Elysia marginata]|uniref:Uncharacterized protein n=1 Tax=Elysia marginata TaxID=1093978 RepID=A0AAV4JZP6_9GAST|nr:hypothetical protein ElyMa_001736100 [Elysia marginata]
MHKCCALCSGGSIKRVCPSLKPIFVFVCLFPNVSMAALYFASRMKYQCLGAVCGALLKGLLVDSKVTDAVWPGTVVRSHSDVEVFKQEQVLSVGDPSVSFLRLLVEDILDPSRRSEGGDAGAQGVSGTRESVEKESLRNEVTVTKAWSCALQRRLR